MGKKHQRKRRERTGAEDFDILYVTVVFEKIQTQHPAVLQNPNVIR